MIDGLPREPISFEDGEGREFIVFDENHTHEDILAYVVNDIGIDDVETILGWLDDGYTDDQQSAGRADTTE